MYDIPAHQESTQISYSRPRRRLSRVQTICWLCILVLGLAWLIYQVFQASGQISDFCQDHTAVQRWFHGIPVYTSSVADCVYHEFDVHPPPTLLLIWPLGWLSLVPAATLWGLFSLAAYLVSGMLLLREVGWRSLQSLTLFILGSILWWPFYQAEILQNWGQLTLLLLAAVWLLQRRGYSTWAGILFGVAGLFRIWPAVYLVVALFLRQWRLARSMAFTLVGGVILSVLLLGWSTYTSYLGPAQANEISWLPIWGNISLPGTIIRFLVGFQYHGVVIPPLTQAVSLKQATIVGEIAGALLLLAVLAFLWCCRQSRKSETVVSLSGGLLITVLLVAFPLTWGWGIITLLLPMSIMLLALRHLPRPPRWWFVMLVLGVLLLLEPGYLLVFIYWLIGYTTGWLQNVGVILFGLPTYGLILFALAQALLLFWARGTQPTSPENKTLVTPTRPGSMQLSV